MAKSLIKWNLPQFVITDDHTAIQVSKSSVRKYDIANYISSIYPNLIYAIILLVLCFLIYVGAEPDSEWQDFVFQIAIILVGIRFGFRILLNLGYLAFRPNPLQESSFEITDEAITYYTGNSEKNSIPVGDIKRVVLKEIRYKKGSRWLLKIKHRNRRWLELEIPANLRHSMPGIFSQLSINYSVSGKPDRGWYNPFQ